MTAIAQMPATLAERLNCLGEVRDAFRNAPYAGLRRVKCRILGGCLILSGPVSSYYLKQVAQSIVMKHWDKADSIDNRLLVDSTLPFDSEIANGNGLPVHC